MQEDGKKIPAATHSQKMRTAHSSKKRERREKGSVKGWGERGGEGKLVREGNVLREGKGRFQNKQTFDHDVRKRQELLGVPIWWEHVYPQCSSEELRRQAEG